MEEKTFKEIVEARCRATTIAHQPIGRDFLIVKNQQNSNFLFVLFQKGCQGHVLFRQILKSNQFIYGYEQRAMQNFKPFDEGVLELEHKWTKHNCQ